MTETYVDQYKVEKAERTETLIPCHILFDEHEDHVIIDLMVTYQRGEYWSEITDVEVDCPDPMIVEHASSFKEDVDFSIEWSTRKEIVGPVKYLYEANCLDRNIVTRFEYSHY